MTEFFPYLMACLGFLAVYVLNDIKGSIKDIKGSIKSLECDMRNGMSTLERRHDDIDHRLIVVEQRCQHKHD